jgi:hypothetical protein
MRLLPCFAHPAAGGLPLLVLLGLQRSEVMFRIRKHQNRVLTCNFSLILCTACMNLACLVRSKCVLSNLFAFSVSFEISTQQCEWAVKN